MPVVAWSDDTAHAPRETPTQSRCGHLDAGGPRRPLLRSLGGTGGVAAPVPPGELLPEARRAAPRRGPADWTQPMRVLPGSIRALIDWRVIELVKVTSTRPFVPPPLLTTCDQPSAELSTTL